jgi:hypothetical protein
MDKFNHLKENVKSKYKIFKDTICMKKTQTKLELITHKYHELKDALLEKPYAHKFNDLLPSLDDKTVTDIILYCNVHFKNKDVYDVVNQHLNKNEIELTEHEIIELAGLLFEFLYVLIDLGFL